MTFLGQSIYLYAIIYSVLIYGEKDMNEIDEFDKMLRSIYGPLVMFIEEYLFRPRILARYVRKKGEKYYDERK